MMRVNKKRCAAVLTLTAMAAGGGLAAGMALANDKHSKIGPYVCPRCAAKKRKGAELKNKKG